MASGIVRKAMVYLGLTDDEYEDYEGYDDGGSATAPALSGAGRKHVGSGVRGPPSRP